MYNYIKNVGTVLNDLLFNYMNRQYSYNNFDFKYMHKAITSFVIHIFVWIGY